ncbi:MAG: DUF2207 domain-containing protein [Actinomycetota bacterium]
MKVRTPVARLLAAAALAALAALVSLPGAARAQGGERIRDYAVRIEIEASGDILVSERIVYDFGPAERHGIFRYIPVRLPYDDRYDRVYEVDDIDVVGSAGTPDDFEVEEVSGVLNIRIGDPDLTIHDRHTYTIRYRMAGALNAFPTHDELYWNAVGTEWAVPIARATVEVTAPVPIAQVTCFAGAFGSNLPCSGSSAGGRRATFSHRDLPSGGGLTIVVGFPTGAVVSSDPILVERWSFARAFSATPLTLSLAGLLLLSLVGAIARMLWVHGRDRRAIGSQMDIAFATASEGEQAVPLGEESVYPVEFAPPEDIRPGQVGVLVDEETNPVDITATMVDLAVRGYLRIEEIPKRWLLGKPDWRLVQLREADGGLLKYEQTLLEGLFRDSDEALEDDDDDEDDEPPEELRASAAATAVDPPTPPDGLANVKLSKLRRSFSARYVRVQRALYSDAFRRRWFAGRPDKVRQSWVLRGFLVLLAGGGLTALAAARTHYGLVPLPIALAGVILMIGARWMPRRTPKGTGLVRRVLGFRTYMATAEAHMARWMEQENLFSRYLPYAIVFGLTKKWAQAFARLGEQPTTTWYVGSRPFTASALASSIDNFAITSAGTLASRPAASGSSGLGGGGFSGGGGGGGGGGSW